MSTAYHVETIERITEQMLTEEVISDVNKIMWDADTQIKNIKTDAVNEIEKITPEAVNAINKIEQDALKYIASEKRDMVFTLGENDADGNPAVRGKLRKIDADTTAIYNKLLDVAPNTEAKIQQNIRIMINEDYDIELVNDGNGNITVNLVRRAV
jgi:DNA-directed RNA polymerase subunit F